MNYPVYKSLDKPSSLFGLKGSYLRYAAIGVGACILIGVIVSRATNGLVGVMVFIITAALVYAATLHVQARYSERERTRWFCSHKLPQFILVPPRRLSHYCRVHFEHGRVVR